MKTMVLILIFSNFLMSQENVLNYYKATITTIKSGCLFTANVKTGIGLEAIGMKFTLIGADCTREDILKAVIFTGQKVILKTRYQEGMYLAYCFVPSDIEKGKFINVSALLKKLYPSGVTFKNRDSKIHH